MTSNSRFENKTVFRTLILSLALALFASPVWAQDDQSDEAEASADTDESVSLDRINVTGSRIKRTELEGPSPVYVIDQDMMSERGYVTVFEALNGLAVNNGLVVEGPEFSGGFTPDVQTINLRSFGVGQTLTLVNGRRLTNYPAAYQSESTVFNYGAIPTAAVERIEVLATGASAIYGSDAVSGVVNIVLRKDIDSNTLNFLWGTTTETHSARNDMRVQFLTGKTFERSNYTFTFQYSDRDGLMGGDYPQYDEETDYPYQGRDGVAGGIPDRQILYYSEWLSYAGWAPWYIDPAENGGCPGPEGLMTYDYRDPNGFYCGHNGVQDTAFRNPRESYSAYLNYNIEVGDKGTELFTDILYYSSESSSHRGALYVFEALVDPNVCDPIWCYYPDWYYLQRGFTSEELGMNLDTEFQDDALTFSMGARGVFRDFHDWEFSYTYSNYEYKSTRPWFKWRSVIDEMLGDNMGLSFWGDQWWSGGIWGEDMGFPWAFSAFSEVNDAVRGAIGNQWYGNESTDHFFTFQMSGDLFEMKSGPLSYAFVMEYQDTDMNYVSDDGISNPAPDTDWWGEPIQTPLVGTDWYKLTGYVGGGDRQRYAIGGELRVPIFDTLTLNLAGRYDDYDSGSTSFGGDFTASGTLEYRPSSDLLVRAGYTESFRAPDMALVFVNTGSFQSGYDLIQCWEMYNFQNSDNPLTAAQFEAAGLTADCESSSQYIRRTGAQNLSDEFDPLDAETGSSWWVGFSWEVTDNLTFQADFIHQELEDRVVTPSVNSILNDEWYCLLGELPDSDCELNSFLVQRGFDPVTNISFIEEMWRTPYNSSFLEADSLDLRVVYTINTELGRFGFTGDYAHILKLEETDVEDKVNLRDDPVAGGWDHRSSFIGTLSHAYGDYAQTWTMTYRGGTTTWRRYSVLDGAEMWGNPDTKSRVDAHVTWNWTGQYHFTDDLLARLRVINVFNQGPPKDETFLWYEDPWFNYYVYSGAAVGRQVYAEIEWTFGGN